MRLTAAKKCPQNSLIRRHMYLYLNICAYAYIHSIAMTVCIFFPIAKNISSRSNRELIKSETILRHCFCRFLSTVHKKITRQKMRFNVISKIAFWGRSFTAWFISSSCPHYASVLYIFFEILINFSGFLQSQVNRDITAAPSRLSDHPTTSKPYGEQ
jgi:hypothetical protein